MPPLEKLLLFASMRRWTIPCPCGGDVAIEHGLLVSSEKVSKPSPIARLAQVERKLIEARWGLIHDW